MSKLYLISCLLLIASLSQAAVINWETPSDVASASDVSTNGTLIEAFNLTFSTGNHTNATDADTTVNGVLFAGLISPAPLTDSSSSSRDNLDGSSTGDTDYDALLETSAFGGGSGQVSMTLGGDNLISGLDYEVQVWYVETRTQQSWRTMQYGDGNGNTVDVAGGGGSYGQYAIGTFTADGSNQTLTMDAQSFANAHLTAYQVRQINTPTSIDWGPATDINSASEISTNGILVEACNLGGTISATNITANTVLFSGRTDFLDQNSNADAFNLDTGDAAYNELLSAIDFGNGGDLITLSVANGLLESGINYEIQVWYADTRNPGRETPVGDAFGNKVNLSSSPGQYAIGTFTANNDSLLLTLESINFGNAHFNAYQIRKLGTQPSSVLSTVSGSVSGAYTVNIAFSEAVIGLEISDFDITNGNLSDLSGSGDSYTILVTPVGPGDITLLLPSSSVDDVDGDNLMNLASNSLVTAYSPPSIPTVVIYGQLATDSPEYETYLSFSEEVTGLSDSDFVVLNGSVSGMNGSGRYYSATVTADSPQTVEVTLPAGVVIDTDGDVSGNTASNTLSTLCTADFGEVWKIDDASTWTSATGSASNMSIADGFVEPTANSADFSSTIKTYTVKKQASSLILRQSPVWDNWIQQNLNPGGTNAPIFVPVGKDDYYFLALGENDVYEAWHSTDMVNWSAKGAVTSGPEGRWVTSAEYKDGNFYIYSDYANDHTSHLFIDDDFSDGIPGTYIGPVLERDGSGSDLSIFRDDADGLFHIIYEDWSPINAQTHSWDSPLAGHTSSEDGINGFFENEHSYAVDHRTTPTGVIGSFNHPYVDFDPTYEIHSPAQDAYGDWTTIKVGARYYLFGDYDPHGQSIILARFSSDSIYKEFDLVGSIDTGGHPDPSVGFAEGKFYLFTQNNDYYSPGPWVEGVEARAGVDTDGNGTIDEWTAWQIVSEQYDYTPNFIRVVSLTPAQLDLSSLSPGYGFQFEFRVDDTVVPTVTPIMDAVEMHFEPSNFQRWANAAAVPAIVDGDENTNGIPNLVEFALGQSSLPERQTDGTFVLPLTSEAVEDGYAASLWFSTNLTDWYESTDVSQGSKLLNTTVTPNGNLSMNYELFPPDGNALFWKLKFALPE